MRVSEARRGSVINDGGELYIVVDMDHRTPGNYQACYQLYLKSLKSGRVFKKRYNPDALVDDVRLQARKAQYLYRDGSGFHFMNLESYETIMVSEELIGNGKNYIKENGEAVLLYYEHRAVALELPLRVDLKVVEAPIGLRGDTEGTARKQVILETGLKVNAPLFIKEGDVIQVDTTTGEYLGRA